MYNNLKVSESNSLKAVIEELLEWCEKKEKEGELGRTFFNEPIKESKMEKWEAENGVKIPESYKDWLRFSEKCQIDGTTATFWGPDDFKSEYVPDDLIVVGEIIGDGQVVCFSKAEGVFVEYYEGTIQNRMQNFNEIIKKIFDDTSAALGLSRQTLELFREFNKKYMKNEKEDN